MRPFPRETTNEDIPKKHISLGNSIKQVVGITEMVTNGVKVDELGGEDCVKAKAREEKTRVEFLAGIDGLARDAGLENGGVARVG